MKKTCFVLDFLHKVNGKQPKIVYVAVEKLIGISVSEMKMGLSYKNCPKMPENSRKALLPLFCFPPLLDGGVLWSLDVVDV